MNREVRNIVKTKTHIIKHISTTKTTKTNTEIEAIMIEEIIEIHIDQKITMTIISRWRIKVIETNIMVIQVDIKEKIITTIIITEKIITDIIIIEAMKISTNQVTGIKINILILKIPQAKVKRPLMKLKNKLKPRMYRNN